MTRGRKKDITIPPTRALALQRDYRARKTQYVADLEARCKAAEEENVRLRQELVFLRQQSRSPAASATVIQASTQLKDTLDAASASLAHFMQLQAACPAANGPPTSCANAAVDSLTGAGPIPDERLSSESADPSRREVVRPGSPCCEGYIVCEGPGSPCCGGYINCEGLVEEETDEANDQGLAIAMVSQLRSTWGD
ncbi:hypothetical protein C8F01DRAFT_376833 [Mycena amicta]|nr:hypothetical protein C8F01DRAFT_376833 [Mycena amicta]